MTSHSPIKNFFMVGWPSVALLTCILCVEFLPVALGETLTYQRKDITDGEYWRLLTGQLVHSNLYHSLLNAVGLALTAIIFAKEQQPKRDLLALFVCASAVAIGLFFFTPYMEIYKGLSGVLHGYLIYFIFVSMKRTPIVAGIALAAILAKVGWEQTSLADLSGTAALIESTVAVEAHLSGAIGGLIIGGVTYFHGRHRLRGK